MAFSVYIAGRYSRRDELKQVAKYLRDRGIGVTSRWLDEDKPLHTQMGDDTPEFYRKTALDDLFDIDRAEAVLFYSEDPLVGTPRGGRHVEFGYALGKEKIMFAIGPKENIFHYLPRVHHFHDMKEFMATLYEVIVNG